MRGHGCYTGVKSLAVAVLIGPCRSLPGGAVLLRRMTEPTPQANRIDADGTARHRRMRDPARRRRNGLLGALPDPGRGAGRRGGGHRHACRRCVRAARALVVRRRGLRPPGVARGDRVRGRAGRACRARTRRSWRRGWPAAACWSPSALASDAAAPDARLAFGIAASRAGAALELARARSGPRPDHGADPRVGRAPGRANRARHPRRSHPAPVGRAPGGATAASPARRRAGGGHRAARWARGVGRAHLRDARRRADGDARADRIPASGALPGAAAQRDPRRRRLDVRGAQRHRGASTRSMANSSSTASR